MLKVLQWFFIYAENKDDPVEEEFGDERNVVQDLESSTQTFSGLIPFFAENSEKFCSLFHGALQRKAVSK